MIKCNVGVIVSPTFDPLQPVQIPIPLPTSQVDTEPRLCILDYQHRSKSGSAMGDKGGIHPSNQ